MTSKVSASHNLSALALRLLDAGLGVEATQHADGLVRSLCVFEYISAEEIAAATVARRDAAKVTEAERGLALRHAIATDSRTYTEAVSWAIQRVQTLERLLAETRALVDLIASRSLDTAIPAEEALRKALTEHLRAESFEALATSLRATQDAVARAEALEVHE